MKRRDFLSCGLAAIGSAPSFAQQKRNVPHIMLIGPAWSEPGLSWTTFLSELRVLGYEEGTSIHVSRHSAQFRLHDDGEWSRVTAEIAREPPDAIVVSSLAWARALRAVGVALPIVVSALDPVEYGLVPSLARPMGNITGIAIDPGPALLGKQLDFLLEICPDVSQVACLGAEHLYRSMREFWIHASQRRVGVQEFFVPDKYEPIFAEMVRGGATAVLVLPEPRHALSANLIATLANQFRLPLISPFRQITEQGGLLSYGADWRELDRRLAGYVARILKGAKPADLPIEQPPRYELVLNRRTAAQLGRSIPPVLLSLADAVIE